MLNNLKVIWKLPLTLLVYRCHAVAQLVEALLYKPEDPDFDFRWCHWNFFNWHNPSGHTVALESTQFLIEMSIRNIS